MHRGSMLGSVAAATALALAGMACGPVGSGAAHPAPGPSASATTTEGAGTAAAGKGSPIFAQVAITNDRVARDSDVEVLVHIENRGHDPVILLAEEMKLPAALFEVRDAYGQRIPPTSPPTQSGEKHVVDPGKSLDIKMSLAGMFSPPLKPGDYSVRLRRIDSAPRAFHITSP